MKDPFILFWATLIVGSVLWYGFLVFYVGIKAGRDIIRMIAALQRNSDARHVANLVILTLLLVTTSGYAGIDPEATRSQRWIDAATLGLEGQGWGTESAPYTRLPDRAEPIVPGRVWVLSRDSSGLVVHFASDSPSLAARWSLRRSELAMRHMPASGVSGLDLYVKEKGRWRWMAVAQRFNSQEATQVLFEGQPAVRREYLLFLPLYNGVSAVSLGVVEGAIIEPVRSDERPVVIYGTSIVQGACASRPGMAYTAILRRLLDQPVVNLGFSGNGCSEPELARLVAEIDAAAFVLDSLPNLQPDQVQRVDEFITILRAAHPRTPIILLGSIRYADANFVEERAERVRRSNHELQGIFDRRRLSDPNLWLVPGEHLLDAGGEDTVDGTHPTDLGFVRMAQIVESVLRQALSQAQQP